MLFVVHLNGYQCKLITVLKVDIEKLLFKVDVNIHSRKVHCSLWIS